jgi:hypothetical protein
MLGAALIAALAWVTWLASLPHGLVSDDYLFTTHPMSWVTVLEGWPHPMGLSNAYRPVTLLTYLFDTTRAAEIEPYIFRRTNLFLYLLAVFSIGTFAWRLTRSPHITLITSVLFSLHPSHHEVLFWISGRPAALGAAIYLLVLALHTPHAPAYWARWFSVFGAALALGSYESTVTLPLAIFVVTLLRRDSPHSARGSLMELGPACLVLFAYFVVRWSLVTSLDRDLLQLMRHQQELSLIEAIRGIPGNTKMALLRISGVSVSPEGHIDVGASPILLAALCAVALQVAARRHLRDRTIVGCLTLSAVGFLPFASYVGYSDRFLFLASAGALLSAVVGLDLTARAGSPVTRAILVLLTVSLALSWGAELRRLALDWVRAGETAARLLDGLVELEPQPPVGATIEVLGVPRFEGSAVVFLTYFERAVHSRYGRADITIVAHFDDASPSESFRAPPTSTRVFVWNRTQRRLMSLR